MAENNDDLIRMFETLTAEVVDDPEDILQWFAECGPSLIREVLIARGVQPPAYPPHWEGGA